MILEKWMICNLEKFGNCLVSSKFYNKHKDKLVEAVQSLGYQDVRVLEIINTHKPANRPGRPKLIKTYIIETQIKRKEETHTEVKKMQKFNIGDKVEIIDGTQKGKIGTVEEVEKNDSGDYTYGIKVPSLYAKIGLMPKQASHLKLEKAARKKAGRPKKVETSKPVEKQETIAELNKATKEIVDKNESEAAVVEEPVEPRLPAGYDFDEPKAPPKSAYDQLMEVYDELCKKLNFVELSTFCDIVVNDMETSKYVLEKMYQMPIADLAKIREELA